MNLQIINGQTELSSSHHVNPKSKTSIKSMWNMLYLDLLAFCFKENLNLRRYTWGVWLCIKFLYFTHIYLSCLLKGFTTVSPIWISCVAADSSLPHHCWSKSSSPIPHYLATMLFQTQLFALMHEQLQGAQANLFLLCHGWESICAMVRSHQSNK